MNRANSRSTASISKLLATSLIAIILVAAILGVLFALNLTRRNNNNNIIGSPFSNSDQFLNDTYFGLKLIYSNRESPVGIASYGIYNNSDSLRSYSINSSEVVGEANITTLAASTNWNYELSPSFNFLACVQCAGLQMNVNAILQTKQGEQVFWIQNGLPFLNTTTTHKVLKPEGIVFNQTTINSAINVNAVGTGGVRSILSNKIVFGSHSFGGAELNYTLPLSVKMTTSIHTDPNGVTISLSNDPFGGGILSRDNNTYLNVYLPISNVTSASLVVSTALFPWSYEYNYGYPTFDSELVWTGYCCAQTAKFTQMNSSLSLMYLNSEGQFVSYPSFYTFGEVVETANNLRVIPTQDGGDVVIGDNNNTYLGT